MATFYQNSDLFYKYKVKIKSGAHSEGDIVGVEFTLGNIQKKYPSNEVEKVADGEYVIRFTQADTLNLGAGVVETQARLVFRNGNVVPTKTAYADVKRTLSNKILGVE